MIAVLHLRPAADLDGFRDRGAEALRVLSERPGFIKGTLGRATDDDSEWVLVTEWDSVGAYRRGLGGYEVKLIATPFMAQAVDQPSAFEPLVTATPDGVLSVRDSDRARDADTTGRDWAH